MSCTSHLKVFALLFCLHFFLIESILLLCEHHFFALLGISNALILDLALCLTLHGSHHALLIHVSLPFSVPSFEVTLSLICGPLCLSFFARILPLKLQLLLFSHQFSLSSVFTPLLICLSLLLRHHFLFIARLFHNHLLHELLTLCGIATLLLVSLLSLLLLSTFHGQFNSAPLFA